VLEKDGMLAVLEGCLMQYVAVRSVTRWNSDGIKQVCVEGSVDGGVRSGDATVLLVLTVLMGIGTRGFAI